MSRLVVIHADQLFHGISQASQTFSVAPYHSGEVSVSPRQADGYWGTCPTCGGSGYNDVECNPCGGTGKNARGENCEWCRGHGKKSVKCWQCNGGGRVFVPDK